MFQLHPSINYSYKNNQSFIYVTFMVEVTTGTGIALKVRGMHITTNVFDERLTRTIPCSKTYITLFDA